MNSYFAFLLLLLGICFLFWESLFENDYLGLYRSLWFIWLKELDADEMEDEASHSDYEISSYLK